MLSCVVHYVVFCVVPCCVLDGVVCVCCPLFVAVTQSVTAAPLSACLESAMMSSTSQLPSPAFSNHSTPLADTLTLANFPHTLAYSFPFYLQLTHFLICWSCTHVKLNNLSTIAVNFQGPHNITIRYALCFYILHNLS